MALGTVKFYKALKGWGAITSPELPPGMDAFVHFSVIEGQQGYREFTAGEEVEFDFVPSTQDSFRFSATRARRLSDAAESGEAIPTTFASAAVRPSPF